MSIPVLLRLLREPLAAGRLVGEAELIETGDRTLLRDTGQLVDYLRERVLSDDKPDAGDREHDRVARRLREDQG